MTYPTFTPANKVNGSAAATAVNVNVEPALADKDTACAMLAGICPRALMQLVAEGHLNARKLGSRTVFEVDELRRFAASLPSWEPKTDGA